MTDPSKTAGGRPDLVRREGVRAVQEAPSTLPLSHKADARARRLLVIAGERVSSHPLPDNGDFAIGRSDDAALRIDDPSVSREHACLHFGKNRTIELSDAGSSNGTRVRGKLLKPGERVAIVPGETLELGSVLLMVQAPFEATSEPDSGSAEPEGLVIEDRTMTGIYKLAERVAKSTINVLLLGETGVGKDVLARRIHEMSPRVNRPFLALNCGALTEALLESELFGHERGAFTGAVEMKLGLLEAADGGTVFLDEVGELPMSVQVKLLRVLEERQVRRVGGIKPRQFDIRFIAATNRDLVQGVEKGEFRADLFYRLNGISLVIPPLRQRLGELEELARRFVAQGVQKAGRPDTPTISDEAMRWLRAHTWPGNIRELQNTMERAVLLCTGAEITPEHLPTQSTAPVPAVPSDEAAHDDDPERRRILEALERCAGNQTRAAKLLGISRNTLLARLDTYGIKRPRKPV
jgi:two-component system, NtrC family, response regulator AtoC